MWPYWALFLIPGMTALVERPPSRATPDRTRQRTVTVAMLSFGAVITLMIGWRHQVGGDWFPYLNSLEQRAGLSIGEVLLLDDPGYKLPCNY